MNHWETCPACGLMFETKTEGDTTMQFNLTVTGDVTPDIAPFFAQLLTGGAAAGSPGESSGAAAHVAKKPTSQAPKAPKSEPAPVSSEDEGATESKDLSSLSAEDFKAKIREHCINLKKAGKKQIILDAYAKLGVNHLDKVAVDDYLDLWEDINNAG